MKYRKSIRPLVQTPGVCLLGIQLHCKKCYFCNIVSLTIVKPQVMEKHKATAQSAHQGSTIKFLNFRMPEQFAVIYLKFKQRCRVFCQKDANGIANSEDPDQTAPLGAI